MSERIVFVYGTLRRGDCRYGVPSFVEMVHEEAFLEGYQLLHLGGFPGIVPGKGRIRGEVHLYSTFRELDGIEGFYEKTPDRSLFRREKVMVEIPSELEKPIELQASVYVFNRAGEKREVIESGDWFSGKRSR